MFDQVLNRSTVLKTLADIGVSVRLCLAIVGSV